LDLAGIASLQGTNEADNISWFPSALTIDAGDGDDVVNGSTFADTISGGKGNDILNGNWGSDTYKYNVGDGSDIIYETGGEEDIILFGGSITFSDLVARIDGVNLIIAVMERGGAFDKLTDRITIRKYTVITAHKIETLKFSDGTHYALGKVLDVLLAREILLPR
jgi:Ca2+-binding RTX toxin-like protein